MIRKLKRCLGRPFRRLAWGLLRRYGRKRPYSVVFWLFYGQYVSAAAYSVLRLGIPDLLREGPRSAQDLARATGVHPLSLSRLMRALASIDLFERLDGDRYALTPYSELLCRDHEDSLYGWGNFCGMLTLPELPAMPDCLETGCSAPECLYGMQIWDYLSKEAAKGKAFDACMAGFTKSHVAAILAAYDFSACNRIVDVGGGRGALLSAVLKACPGLNGTLYDREPVMDAARQTLEEAGVADRGKAVAGNFLESVPEGADLYIIKHVLHDWDDENAVTILTNIARAMKPSSKLLIMSGMVEHAISKGEVFREWWDIAQWFHTGGRERTPALFEELAVRAGLRIESISPTRVPDVVILQAVRQDA